MSPVPSGQEAILSGTAESCKIAVMGTGSRLIAGTLSADLERQAVEQTVLEGFFPIVDADDPPAAGPQRHYRIRTAVRAGTFRDSSSGMVLESAPKRCFAKSAAAVACAGFDFVQRRFAQAFKIQQRIRRPCSTGSTKRTQTARGCWKTPIRTSRCRRRGLLRAGQNRPGCAGRQR